MIPREKINDPKYIFVTTFSAGALADLCAMFFAVPAEVVQQRLQIQGAFMKRREYNGAIDAFYKIYQTDGLKGLYRGAGAAILRTVPASAIWWSTYELTKNWLHDHNPRNWFGSYYYGGVIDGKLENEDPLIQSIAGAVAATVSLAALNPIDVAKTRLQTQDMMGTTVKYRTTFTALKNMYQCEGIRSFYKGFVPSLMVSVPSSIVSIVIYEYVKKLSVSKI